MGEFPESVPEWGAEEDPILEGIEELVDGVFVEMEREKLSVSTTPDVDTIEGIISFIQNASSWFDVQQEALALDQLRSDPETYLYFREGVTSFTREDYQSARDFFSRILKPSLFVTFMVAESEFCLGHFGEALVEYEKILGREPRNIAALVGKSFAYDGLGRPEEQVRVLDQVLAVNNRARIAWRSRGFAYYGLEAYEKARDDFRKAVELEPSDVGARFYLGKALYALGDYDAALESTLAAQQSDPDDAEISLHVGCIYHLKEDYEPAAMAYRRALDLSNGNLEQRQLALWGLGKVQLDLEQLDDAQATATELIRAGGSSGYLIRAWALALKRDFPAAEKDCRQALKETDNQEALQLMGYICKVQGRTREARKYFKQAE